MTRAMPGRLLARAACQTATRRICPASRLQSQPRFLSTTITRLEDEKSETPKISTPPPKISEPDDRPRKTLASLYGIPKEGPPSSSPAAPAGSAMADLSKSLLFKAATRQSNRPRIDTSSLRLNELTGSPLKPKSMQEDRFEPYHFHVYALKRNTHVTVTRPNREPILSISCGNLGFRKARRKLYDAAYQTVAMALEKLYANNWHEKINQLEVVFRDFGPGRDAATRVLLSPEGKALRSKIVKVSDGTRIKYGGPRSQKPRRI